MSWVTVAVGVGSALNNLSAGRTANLQAGLQASQEDYQAKVEEQTALSTAQVIRRAGARQVGAANAAYAGAGVKVGEGSAERVEQEITQDYEHDAYQAILEGKRRARGLTTDAQMTRIGGRMAEQASYANAANSLLGSFAQGARSSGWRTKGPGFSGTQAPAPVEDRSIYSNR
jgi:hypothetical protein